MVEGDRTEAAVAPSFHPSSVADLAPSGPKARAIANMSAIRLVQQLDNEDRTATPDEQAVLARWGSWGAIPDIFDEDKPQWARERDELRAVLTEDEYWAASRTTINAHYTDPEITKAMWTLAADLGFDGGDVLEPGCGSGNFIGLAPDTARMVGVELDPMTARIASKLYPTATIRTESFAQTRVPDGSFDMAIGNVPFAKIALHDARHNAAEHVMHNHFLIKSVALTRPGGLVVALTSHFTLDSQNPAARRALHESADLVGAVRLPTGAHKRLAGTEAVTDIVILRRRLPGERPGDDLWVGTNPKVIDGEQVRLNNYFDAHPDRVLGELGVGHGMHGSATLTVTQAPDAFGMLDLRGQLSAITTAAQRRRWVLTERSPDHVQVDHQAAAAQVGSGEWTGHITAKNDGTFTVLQDGVHQPLTIPRTQAVEARALLDLRDQTRGLLEAESSRLTDDDTLDGLRTKTRNSYDRYVAKYGPINRFTTHVITKADKNGEPQTARQRRTPPVMARLRSDPFLPLVKAIETFDDTAHKAEPAKILTERVVVPRQPVQGADGPEDALAICMDTTGRADLPHIARLLGTSEDDARDQLGTRVFDDPASTGIIPAAEYLSGDVRTKLAAAKEAAHTDQRFATNVEALTEVVPPSLGADEIEARLGAVWIPASDVQQFLSEILADPNIKVEHPGGNVWEVRGNNRTQRAQNEWGTERVPAPRIAQTLLEQRVPKVTDEGDDGKRIPNPTETVAAQEKGAAMQERFSEWIWEDPERATRLLADYNKRFNSIVLRDYTAEGQALSLPGLAKTITLRDHQRTAVARMISEPAVLLAHAVGAGKTLEAATGITELKRLGLVKKPAIVVPNHLLEQFAREFLAAFPAARLLAASKDDVTKENRRAFVARIATHDWDAIVMTRTAFEKLQLTPQAQADYLDRQTQATRDMLTNAKGSENRLSVKRLEKTLLAQEEKIKKALDGPKDDGVGFEMTGIDYVLVDEAHEFKNLMTSSNVAAIAGSNRAMDLHMKVDWLRSQHGNRIATFMTATPIANSVAEAHVMSRYLRPDLLADAGVEHFDAWAATFGSLVTDIEMDPSGTTFRQKTRFAKFQNVPEMLRMWHTFADVKTHDDLNLPVPAIAARSDGQRQPETVLIEPGEELLEYVQNLGARAELVRSGGVDPSEDNMLKISSDGRRAALDMRLVRPLADPVQSATKAEVAADKIADIWHNTRDHEYVDPETKEISPVKGAAQVVFCDQSTPKEESWDFYHELKAQLIARGVDPEQIRFIHEARNDVEKAQLFAAARAGHCTVLIGSTAKMGTGANFQARLIASHHADAPWRPADVEQQIGRSIRQGNQNPEVQIYRYITEGSFDSYSWQTLERKARFIGQVTRGKLDVRDIEDVGDTALSFAEVKALASGDPMVLEKARVDTDLARLERLQRAHNRSTGSLHQQIDMHRTAVTTADEQLPLIEAGIERTVPTKAEAFSMTVEGKTTDDRGEAAVMVAQWANKNVSDWIPRSRELGAVGQLGGHTIEAGVRPSGLGIPPGVAFSLKDVPRSSFTVDLPDVREGKTGPIIRLENRIQALPQLAERTATQREESIASIAECQASLDRPFKHATALAELRTKAEQINEKMAARADPPQPPPEDSSSTASPPKNPAPTTPGTNAAAVAFPHTPQQATASLPTTVNLTPEQSAQPPAQRDRHGPHV